MKTLSLTGNQIRALDRIIGNISQTDIEKFMTPYGYTNGEIRETQNELFGLYYLVKDLRKSLE